MNGNEIMVTVLCSAYNHEKYIRDALEGFIKQKTSFAFEVVIHDDASTDKTADIIREYEIKYPDIIKPIYQTVNQFTVKVNRIYAHMLPRARGKYIAFCEGDDYWTSENKLQAQFDYMEAHPECALVAHMAMTHNLDGNYVEKYTSRDFSTAERCLISAEEIINNHLIFPTASMFFRRDYYERHKELLTSIKTFDYVHKMLLATEGTVYVIPEVMSVYRYGGASSWTKTVSVDKEKMVKHLELAVNTLLKLDEYRDFKYHDVIQANIAQRRFDILVKTLDIKAMKKEPYLEMYRKLPIKKRFIIWSRKYARFAFNMYRGVARFIKRVINRKNKTAK
ncbi:MAG: glycosyltransferase [Clostridia bacterium]|nr:glycosyltransferase [Clostridia bacterium]